MVPPANFDDLSRTELKSLAMALFEQAAEQQRIIAELRDEIARLKGGPRRPNIKPSGMEKGTEPKPDKPAGERRAKRGSTKSKLTIHEEKTVEADAPAGSRFKGYTSFVVQDLVIRAHVTNFRCERWQTPDGKMVTAPLPAGIDGHFGPQLRRLVLALYHQGQMTVPGLVRLLRSLGIFISKRQVVRLLNAGQDAFLTEARDVLRAGLSSANWITVDDTGARHKAANGFCTQIGNEHFAWFGTTDSKSRLNFLERLRAGHSDYVINDEAIAYMRERALASHVITHLLEHPARSFADQTAWNAHLEKLGISALEVNPDPVLIATEGALWGSIKAHGFLPDTVIVSDDAGQFDVGLHALCWVHYLESDFILGSEPWDLMCQGNYPETTQDKKQESKRLKERQEIWLRCPRLGRIRLDAGVFPEGLQGVALHLEVYRQVSAGRCQARVAEIVANRHQVGPGLQERRGTTVTQHVRGDVLARERRSVSGCDGRSVLVENVSNAVAGQGLAAVIDEDLLLVRTGIHAAQAV